MYFITFYVQQNFTYIFNTLSGIAHANKTRFCQFLVAGVFCIAREFLTHIVIIVMR